MWSTTPRIILRSAQKCSARASSSHIPGSSGKALHAHGPKTVAFTRRVGTFLPARSMLIQTLPGRPMSEQHRHMCSDASETNRPAVTMFSEEEEALRESVATFAREVIGPKVMQMDKEGAMDKEVVEACFAQGIMGIEAPEEYGGVGMGFTAACLAVEEVAKVDPAVAVMIDIHNTLLITAFMRYGSEEQKSHYLPKLCQEYVGSFCLSEPGSGSDAFALKTKSLPLVLADPLSGGWAEWDEGSKEWVLDGGKCWISNSMEAGLFLVFANADFNKGHRGITAFIVERGAAGLTIGKKEDKLGIRASSTCELSFDTLRLPASAVLGEVGTGYKMAISLLNEGRIGIGAQGAFEAAMPYLHQRRQFGSAIADFQGMQFQYARARTDIEAARLLVYNAARLKEAGRPFLQEAAMAKLYASETACSVASQCIDWLGGVGFTTGMPAEKFYRDSKIGTIYEGTSNIQLQTIAKNIQKEYK